MKGDNGKYCVGYAVTILSDVVEAASLSITTSAQYTKLYALTWACTLVKDKTASVYTDRDMLSEYLMILECSGSNVPSLFLVEIKFKTVPMFKNY